MEPHAVPQNIIDVEFKLFGAFSLRQFGQMAVGCIVGVVIYLIPFIPFLLKVPLIFIAVGIGLLTAFIPNFGTWIAGFAKALILAPRYVWVKEPAKSDIFSTGSSIKEVGSVKVKSVDQQRDNIDLLIESGETDDSPEVNILDDFLSPTGQPQVKSDYFNKLYDNVFEGVNQQKESQNSGGQAASPQIATQALTVPPVQPGTAGIQNQNLSASNQASVLATKPKAKRVLNIQEILSEIEILKNKLPIAIKNNNKELENEILNLINDLYQEYKVLKNDNLSTSDTAPQDRKNMVSAKPLSGKIIFGIVVSKSDKPISNAKVVFTNVANNESFSEVTSNDGKFATHLKIPFGEYNIQIIHPELKFHTYKIQVTENRLPAFKFREK